MDNILFLLNPLSNESRSADLWKKACKKYPELPLTPPDITKISNLTEYIQQRKPECIVVGGGDGSMNAVGNAIFNLPRKPLLLAMPLGFGNGLAYCFGTETLDKAMHVLKNRPNQVTIDMIQTNIHNNMAGLFNIGIGFDARIVHNRMNHRYIGLRSYIISALRGILDHTEKEMTFTIDHTVTLKATAACLVVANCPIIGQNYVISPSARLNDGLLDCTLFSTKFAYLTNLRLRGFKHPLYSELGKVHFKAQHIKIEGEPFVQVDGDPLIHKEEIELESIPRQITFLCNTITNIDYHYAPFISEQ